MLFCCYYTAKEARSQKLTPPAGTKGFSYFAFFFVDSFPLVFFGAVFLTGAFFSPLASSSIFRAFVPLRLAFSRA